MEIIKIDDSDFEKYVVGRKPCSKCGGEIKFFNLVSFRHSIKRGGTLCRSCCGQASKQAMAERKIKIADASLTGSILPA
jgi:hypothetical protein